MAMNERKVVDIAALQAAISETDHQYGAVSNLPSCFPGPRDPCV